MRRTAFLLIAALVLALSATPAALAQADKDCADFSSQAEAQAYFEANGGSPTNNVDNLDADHDGQACEAFDYGDGGAGGDGTGGNDSDLPFTGTNTTLLPAGAALVLAGLALVGVTRHRARHARR
jgi:Excalibur calcium-binding domain/LPXTG cell wall anchor motif